MSAVCDVLARDLELFADGELRDARRLRRLRRHLERCARCRDSLAAHDALTRGILEDDALSSGAYGGGECSVGDDVSRALRRLERIVERLEDASPPVAGKHRGDVRSARWRVMGFTSSAAAALVAAALLHFGLLYDRGGDSGVELESPPALLSGGARGARAARDGYSKESTGHRASLRLGDIAWVITGTEDRLGPSRVGRGSWAARPALLVGPPVEARQHAEPVDHPPRGVVVVLEVNVYGEGAAPSDPSALLVPAEPAVVGASFADPREHASFVSVMGMELVRLEPHERRRLLPAPRPRFRLVPALASVVPRYPAMVRPVSGSTRPVSWTWETSLSPGPPALRELRVVGAHASRAP